MTIYTKEDEPVAELVAHTERNHALIKITKRSDTYLALGTPLYTHQDTSDLRETAEEALKLLVNLESGYGFEDDSEYAVLDNLRAALEAI